MKQKKTMKALFAALMAFAILIASPSVAYAAASGAAGSEAVSTTAAETSETAAATDGNINAAPNTGVDFPFPPMAAVFLALSMAPVIVLASRKPVSSSHSPHK